MSSRGKGDQTESEVFCNTDLKDSNCPVIYFFREVPLALWRWLKRSAVGQCSGKPQESRWTARRDTVCGHCGEKQNKLHVIHLSCRSFSSHPQNKHMCMKCFPLSRREILERWLMSNLFTYTLAHVWSGPVCIPFGEILNPRTNVICSRQRSVDPTPSSRVRLASLALISFRSDWLSPSWKPLFILLLWVSVGHR